LSGSRVLEHHHLHNPFLGGSHALGDMHIAPMELAAVLIALARRVQRVCLLLLLGSLALMAGSAVVAFDPNEDKLVFGIRIVLYLAFFAAFGWLMLTAHFRLDSLPRRDIFMPRNLPRLRRLPEAGKLRQPYRTILLALSGERTRPFAAVARGARRRFVLAFTLLPLVCFAPDAWFSHDRLLGLSGLAVWTYLSFYITHEALRYFDLAIDEYLRIMHPELWKR
jgi:hypothetical protein